MTWRVDFDRRAVRKELFVTYRILVLRRSLAVLACLFACHALAASPLVDARLTASLIQNSGPFETTGPAAEAKPGDVVEYTARYNNRGDAAAQALAATMPIPFGTEYVPDRAARQPTYASLDAISYAPIPLHRMEKGTDGILRDVAVPLNEYRALRWTVGTLLPGHEVSVRVRVRVAPLAHVASR